jgi:hypothetical protein
MRPLLIFVSALAATCIFFCCKTENKPSVAKQVFPSYDPQYAPPAGYSDTFTLSQDYPDTFDTRDQQPWLKFDFKTDYAGYMNAVLKYCIEGNLDVDFKVQDNKVRKWYHAPWLHYGTNGREYHRGLTRERNVPAKELLPTQDVDLENWAVGFYNAPGGYTIGKVWLTGGAPSTKNALFPEGTVSFKLLFTTGPVDKVPFLKGSKEWTANVFRCNPDKKAPDSVKAKCIAQRYDSTVRLLQIDIAVKDSRAGAGGWVFGTFVYDGGDTGKTVWDRMAPVGLMWGDDSGVDSMLHREGAFINPALHETVLNPALIATKEMSNGTKAYMSHHGLGGRLNGPVDNPISSCISCHSKAALQANGTPAPMADFRQKRSTFSLQAFKMYFSFIPAGNGVLTINGQQYNQVDYSLQLSAGIRNYFQSQIDAKKGLRSAQKADSTSDDGDLPEVTRDGRKE